MRVCQHCKRTTRICEKYVSRRRSHNYGAPKIEGDLRRSISGEGAISAYKNSRYVIIFRPNMKKPALLSICQSPTIKRNRLETYEITQPSRPPLAYQCILNQDEPFPAAVSSNSSMEPLWASASW